MAAGAFRPKLLGARPLLLSARGGACMCADGKHSEHRDVHTRVSALTPPDSDSDRTTSTAHTRSAGSAPRPPGLWRRCRRRPHGGCQRADCRWSRICSASLRARHTCTGAAQRKRFVSSYCVCYGRGFAPATAATPTRPRSSTVSGDAARLQACSHMICAVCRGTPAVGHASQTLAAPLRTCARIPGRDFHAVPESPAVAAVNDFFFPSVPSNSF